MVIGRPQFLAGSTEISVPTMWASPWATERLEDMVTNFPRASDPREKEPKVAARVS